MPAANRLFTFIIENTKRIRIFFDEIAHIEACNQYVIISLLNGIKYKPCMRFKWFHQNETVQQFLVQVHQSHMVNPECVQEVNDKALVIMECGTEVPCHKKYFAQLMKRIADTDGYTPLEDDRQEPENPNTQ